MADRDGTGADLLFRRDSRRRDYRRKGWRPGDPGRAWREGRREGKWGQGTGVATNTEVAGQLGTGAERAQPSASDLSQGY